jgi:lethal(2) giant larvae protein
MRLVYELQSAQLYDAYTDPDAAALAADDDDWPPFKKVGAYDPFSDDPSFTVQRVSMCANTGTLVIGGSAGQTLVCTLRTSADDTSLTVTSQLEAHIIADSEPNFTWKGNKALSVARTQLKSIAYTAAMLVQCQPPAAVTAVALDSLEKL